MKLKIKKLAPHAKMPTRAHLNDAGLDIYCDSVNLINSETNIFEYGTSVALEIPEGFVGILCPRSSISNTNSIMANSLGILDSSYRGEIKIRLKAFGTKPYKIGERIAQLLLLPVPKFQIVEVDELSNTDRGTNGFGSTGRS